MYTTPIHWPARTNTEPPGIVMNLHMAGDVLHSRKQPRFAALAGGSLLAFCMAPAVLAAVPDPVAQLNAAVAKADVAVHPVRGNVSVIEGAGGNIGVFAGTNEKFMVDAGIAVSGPKLIAALARLGPSPVRYVVNTHWHWDHTDGNAWLREAGATVLATPATRKYMSKATRIDEWNHTFPASAEAGLPTELIEKSTSYRVDDETIIINPLAQAHTDGDLTVYFQQADVLFLGDTFWNGAYPFIDNTQGGNINGLIRAADINLALTTAKTAIVPGHGAVADRQQLIAFRDMLTNVREKVAELKLRGLSREQVIAAKPTTCYDALWGHSIVSSELFTAVVYDGIGSYIPLSMLWIPQADYRRVTPAEAESISSRCTCPK